MDAEHILTNTTLWYCVAFFAFFAFAIAKGRKPLIGWLDSEIARVRNELEEAKKLRADAQATLAEYVEKQKHATQVAEKIITQAREDAARLRLQGEKDLQSMLDKHEEIFVNRLRLVHEEAIAEVRAYIIDEVLREARGKLGNIAKTDEATKLVDQIIGDLPTLKHQQKAG